jgi:methionyl-tRNA formyltransferase
LKGETQTGVTIIKVTPGLDSGDMILQVATDIRPDDTTGSLEARLAGLGARLAVEAVRKYKSGEAVEGVKQDSALVTKAPKIKKEFGLIDWNKPADEIERHVRAMQPWPTAYTFFHRPGKEPMRIILNKVAPDSNDPGIEPSFGIDYEVRPTPGSLDSYGSWLWVACRDKMIAIVELQPAGKKKMTAEEFLRGYPLVEGMRFGPEVSACRSPPARSRPTCSTAPVPETPSPPR